MSSTRSWIGHLPVDPLPALLQGDDRALHYFVRRDLLGEAAGPLELLWTLPAAQKTLARQQADGSWRYPGQNRQLFPETNYDLLETFRQVSLLVEMYGLTREHEAMAQAAEYFFSCQTAEGDIRGILGTQHMPYYHALISELLISMGYAEDPRLENGLEWLLSMRQDDGGWIIPMQAVPAKEKVRAVWSAPPVLPDRSLPHAHLATGMVLRAFAVHPRYRRRPEALRAAEQLKMRFFQPDKYYDRKAPLYWTKFQFPFWWNTLLTALDSLSLMWFSADDADVRKALDWFVAHQEPNGLWKTGYEQAKRKESSDKELAAKRWVALAVCRVLQRFWR